jgi:hypothetical protein
MPRYQTLLVVMVTLLAGGCSFIGDLPSFDSVPNPIAKDDSGRTEIDTRSEQAERHDADTLKEIEKR